jgi:pimeloyl-ACP methyl ester carboxylesterase
MNQVVSRDGTVLAYERVGSGPAVILIRAGFVDRDRYRPHAEALGRFFTVYLYDRRANGDSGNNQPYALEREVEDVEAMVGRAQDECPGELPCLYGVSTGGALALEAAAAGVAAHRLAVYEVPYCVAGDTGRKWREYIEQLWFALAAGNTDEALEIFMRFSGSSEFDIIAARNSRAWKRLAADSYKLAYDAASTGDGQPPVDRLAKIGQPTLVATGGVPADARVGMVEMPADFYDRAADAIAANVPHTERMVFDGCAHEPDPDRAAITLNRFFTGAS